jgi:hypothetical protein
MCFFIICCSLILESSLYYFSGNSLYFSLFVLLRYINGLLLFLFLVLKLYFYFCHKLAAAPNSPVHPALLAFGRSYSISQLKHFRLTSRAVLNSNLVVGLYERVFCECFDALFFGQLWLIYTLCWGINGFIMLGGKFQWYGFLLDAVGW